ncbi:uncharacterized protein YktA (UPF0223 family) [Natronobacillus azotifigens]|uniref:UPF0223 family protein n=1 Tax=Natronobacillus azotifigens TaxID=472978 RepID=A0A9J6RF25_9BACI|nr:UPF0223 family protein [Natronobacillus azotifigens]MCZ0703972.1 UPF0223 family protein [Natronobacillus azotifigens]
MQYSYPIDETWSTQETIKVVEFLALVEKVYQVSVPAQQILSSYQQFKQVVPSMSEEKTIGRDFEASTGFSIYRTVKLAKENKDKKIKL